MNEQLIQAQKMESMGRLIGNVAHDFNNLITPIVAISEWMLFKKDLKEEDRENLREIYNAGMRCANLTRHLLTFSKHQNAEKKVIDINQQLQDFIPVLKRILGENIDVKLELNKDPIRVFVDPTQFEQVVLNLVVNAKEAMPEGGKLTIITYEKYICEDDKKLYPGANAGKYLVLEIQDTGIGIGKDIIDKIFEPFYTTKPEGTINDIAKSIVYLAQENLKISILSEI